MKKLSLLNVFTFFFAVVLFLASCEETGQGLNNVNPPILDVTTPTGQVAGDVTVAPGSVVQFKLTATSGDNTMKSVAFQENGSTMSDYATRLKINGAPATTGNVLLFNDERTDFIWDVAYTAPATTGSTTFTIKITDDTGVTNVTKSFVITTAIATEFDVQLVNTPSSIEAAAGSLVKVSVSATRGAAALSTLTVAEDGSTITDLDRLRIGEVSTSFTANPLTLDGGLEAGFNTDFWVKAQDASGVTKSYTFTVADLDGATKTVSFDIVTPSNVAVSISPSSNMTTAANSFIKFTATVAGSTLTVLEDGTAITDLSRLRVGDIGTQFDANPLTIQNGTYDIWVKSHTEGGTTKTYTFQTADANNNTQSATIDITTQSDIRMNTNLLFNAAGPSGTGGLDLDYKDASGNITGLSTGSTDANADLKDLGIDTSQPTGQNWRQKFAPTNGAVLTVAQTTGENAVSFDAIQSQSQLEDAYNNGSTTISETSVVNVGDLFFVNTGTNIYLLKVTNVNVTADNNNDSYTFDVKF